MIAKVPPRRAFFQSPRPSRQMNSDNVKLFEEVWNREKYTFSPAELSSERGEKEAPRFSAAGMARMKNHEKSGWVLFIWNPGLVLTAGCVETPGRAWIFISDQSKEVSQDRERRRKLHRCIQTAGTQSPPAGTQGISSKLFQPSFVIFWRISTNEPSLESVRSQQSDGAILFPCRQGNERKRRF